VDQILATLLQLDEKMKNNLAKTEKFEIQLSLVSLKIKLNFFSYYYSIFYIY